MHRGFQGRPVRSQSWKHALFTRLERLNAAHNADKAALLMVIGRHRMLDFSVNVARNKRMEPRHRLWNIARLSGASHLGGRTHARSASEPARHTIDYFTLIAAG